MRSSECHAIDGSASAARFGSARAGAMLLVLLSLVSVPLARAGEVRKPEDGRNHWAFQPVRSPVLPTLRATDWVRSPVDAFILEGIEKAGLTPAAPAERRTLIRRVTYDLTGLPPTPAEVEAFVLDNSPDAFGRVVDRLLASPHYGERWGRHWLDVARYADSNGLDENIAHGNAWRYRDYVIDSFNRDKPYDRFVMEQIAGDLLPESDDLPARQERVIATGFLSLGAKVLAEPDPRKMEMDIIDEQIDTLGKTFMGMTLGCARCHDHKFDPVPTEEYYALAAIFKSTRTMDNFKIVADWHEPVLAAPAEVAARDAHLARIAAKKEEINARTAAANAELREGMRACAVEYLAAAARVGVRAPALELERVGLESELSAPLLRQCRDHLAGQSTNAVFQAWHEAMTADGDSARVEAEYRPRFEAVSRALREMKRADGAVTNVLSDPVLEADRRALEDPKGFLALPSKPDAAYPAAVTSVLARMREEQAALEKNTPILATAMGVTDGTNVLKTLAVHVRGSHLNLATEVPRGMPRALSADGTPPRFTERQSGRLELARWLVSPEHPLTARVMVNRVWRWHFGRGLVNSTDNFGVLGERPTHPELLDWLAARFVRDGWSVKALHRLILNSAVYQQSAVSEHAAADPDNRWLARFPVRRLEAEEIRDSLLAVSGMLDRTMGGKTIPLKNREFVFNHTSKDATTYESRRRAVYLPVIRNHLYDMLEQFDYPDPAAPTGSRNETVIAPQALLMMNADLVLEAGERLARDLAGRPGLTVRERVSEAWLRLYGRPPTGRELARAEAFLSGFGGGAAGSVTADRCEARAWSALCHSLLAANEFSYLH